MPISDPFISLYSQFINLATTHGNFVVRVRSFISSLPSFLEQTMQTAEEPVKVSLRLACVSTCD